MDVLGSTGQVELNLFRTQLDEERQTRALASGLRVVSASDDPSGLAISQTIQTKVLGLEQGTQNAQTAKNALAVADSTLGNVEEILQRIHTLITEAASDLNSLGQLQSIQTEIASLLQEINKISTGTKFNGKSLLDGSLTNAFPPQATITQVGSPAQPSGAPATGSTVTDFDGLGHAGLLVGAYNPPGGTSFGAPSVGVLGSINSYISIQVTGYSANAVDPDTGNPVGAGDYVTITAYSTDSKMGAAPLYVDTSAVAVNSGQTTQIQYTSPSGAPGDVLLLFSLANLTAQDVGATMAFETYAPPNTSQSPGSPLQVNTSGTEGGDVHIQLPSISTTALNIADISVLPTTSENYLDQSTGATGNQVTTQDAEARVSIALDTISQARATVGAQSVSLGEESDDANVETVNQIASESAIRDADIGQAASALTRDQVMAQVATSVLAQMHADAQLVVELVNGANPITSGKV